MSVDLFIADCLIQTRAEGVAPHDADDKRIVRRRKGLCRPFHETREVEQKHGLNLIFRRRIRGIQAMRGYNHSRAGCH